MSLTHRGVNRTSIQTHMTDIGAYHTRTHAHTYTFTIFTPIRLSQPDFDKYRWMGVRSKAAVENERAFQPTICAYIHVHMYV